MAIKLEKARAAAAGSHRRRSDIIAGSLLGILVVLGLFPFVFMLLTSLKTNAQFFNNYWGPSLPFHVENFTNAWGRLDGYLWNTIAVTGMSIVAVILLGSISAFVLSRREVAGRTIIFAFFSALLMVPSIASLIPLFVLMRDLGLLNTYWVLVIPYVATGTVLATVLMRNFIEGIPEELFEAARLDGANGMQLYLRVVVPLSGPIMGTVTMITALNIWNDYFWPQLTITDDALRTVSIGVAFFQGQYDTNWGPLFAGYFLASLPLLLIFIFASRYFIAGVQGSSGGGVK